MKKPSDRSDRSPRKRLVLRRDSVRVLTGVAGGNTGGDNGPCTGNETGCAGSNIGCYPTQEGCDVM
jgi:hypothetical protein